MKDNTYAYTYINELGVKQVGYALAADIPQLMKSIHHRTGGRVQSIVQFQNSYKGRPIFPVLFHGPPLYLDAAGLQTILGQAAEVGLYIDDSLTYDQAVELLMGGDAITITGEDATRQVSIHIEDILFALGASVAASYGHNSWVSAMNTYLLDGDSLDQSEAEFIIDEAMKEADEKGRETNAL